MRYRVAVARYALKPTKKRRKAMNALGAIVRRKEGEVAARTELLRPYIENRLRLFKEMADERGLIGEDNRQRAAERKAARDG